MKYVLRSAVTAGWTATVGFARGVVRFARSTTGAACTVVFLSCDATARVFVVSFADFFADFLAGFLAGFVAAFFAAFLGATFFAAFFEALPDFLTTRLLLVAPFLAARFFGAAFLPARAGGALRAFFALRF